MNCFFLNLTQASRPFEIFAIVVVWKAHHFNGCKTIERKSTNFRFIRHFKPFSIHNSPGQIFISYRNWRLCLIEATCLRLWYRALLLLSIRVKNSMHLVKILNYCRKTHEWAEQFCKIRINKFGIFVILSNAFLFFSWMSDIIFAADKMRCVEKRYYK